MASKYSWREYINMARRRMFSLDIVDTDKFLETPLTAQCLYFHMGMRADDDGFVCNPNRIMRMVGFSKDDMKLLIAKGFIIPFESGVCVVTHWKQHNYIQSDRYTPTRCIAEKALLGIDDGKEYVQISATQNLSRLDTECIHR